MIKPGVSTDQVARLWPTAREIGLEVLTRFPAQELYVTNPH